MCEGKAKTSLGNREVLQTEFRYDFRKGSRQISTGTVFTVFKAIMQINTVAAEI